MLNGKLYHRLQWVRRTKEKGCSLLPTLKAMDGDRGSVGAITRFNARTGRKSLKSAIGNLQPDINAIEGQLNPEFSEWMMGLPIGWTEITPILSVVESPTDQED
jgi:hypothetical protein